MTNNNVNEPQVPQQAALQQGLPSPPESYTKNHDSKDTETLRLTGGAWATTITTAGTTAKDTASRHSLKETTMAAANTTGHHHSSNTRSNSTLSMKRSRATSSSDHMEAAEVVPVPVPVSAAVFSPVAHLKRYAASVTLADNLCPL
ncbi:hypothetical protein EV175_000242 [Coemansia sp. RSA 1933]|nr:hypothetical protein EV175_000242 [Coemansia sp. RSA 1933]